MLRQAEELHGSKADRDATRPEYVNKWGYVFKWTPEHIPAAEIAAQKKQYDELGSAALERLLEIGNAQTASAGEKGAAAPRRPDLYATLKEHHGDDAVLRRFWEQTHAVPDWVDWEQLRRGQRVFYRYSMLMIVGLAFQGFLGETSSSPGVAEVLARTGGFNPRVLRRRFFETFQWLLQVTRDPAGLRPGGDGHVATVRVRLLHATVRRRILALAAARPGYFDVDRWGVPINDIDSIHSICQFCANPMFMHLPAQGVQPTAQETADFIALFRYVAHVIGAPTAPFASPRRARATMESLVAALEVSATSRTVGANFAATLVNWPPMNPSRAFVAAATRWMNGPELCDLLGIDRPGWYYDAVMLGHCVVGVGLTWATRLVPALDRRAIAFFRDLFWNFAIEGKSGLGAPTKFEFQYVPEEGKMLQMPGEAAPSAKPPPRPFERGLFGVFLFGCFCVVGIALGSIWLASGVVKQLINIVA